MSRQLVVVLFSWTVAALAQPQPPVTPDAIAWGNAVELATQAVIGAQSEVRDRQSVYKRDSVLHSQAIYLHQHSAIAEEEFRTSEWKLARDKRELDLSGLKVDALKLELEMQKLQLAFEQGNPPSMTVLATTNIQLWEKRLEIARKTVDQKSADRDYRRYEYDLARKLLSQNADSQSHLLVVASQFEVADDALTLANDEVKSIEGALQRAQTTLEKIRHEGGR